MKGFSAKVETATGADKIAELELENGETITVFDGKRRLEDAEGGNYTVKCVANIEEITIETDRKEFNEEKGIANYGNSRILVIGQVNDKDARDKWVSSRGKPLIEVKTDIGQVALRQDSMPDVEEYRLKEEDYIRAVCNRFTIVNVERNE